MTRLPPLTVLETALYSSDLAAAEAFYRDVLGLALHARVEGRHVFFRAGEAMLLLFNPDTTRQPGAGSTRPLGQHGAYGPGHVAFRVLPEDLAGWRAQLVGAGVPIEGEVDWPGGGRSIYFRDPAGNSLEFATPLVWRLT